MFPQRHLRGTPLSGPALPSCPRRSRALSGLRCPRGDEAGEAAPSRLSRLGAGRRQGALPGLCPHALSRAVTPGAAGEQCCPRHREPQVSPGRDARASTRGCGHLPSGAAGRRRGWGGGASPQRPLRPPTIDSHTTRAAPRTRRPRLSGGRGAGSRTAHARQPPPFWWGRELSSGSGGGGARWARLGGGGECALAAEMANIAVQRIKREFKEVLKSEEVRAAPAALRRHPPRLRGGSAGAGEGAGARRPAGGLAAPRPHLPARRVGWSRGLGEGNGDSRGEGTHREGGRGGGGDLPQREPGGAGPARRRPGGKPPLRAGRCGAARCQPGGWGLPRPPAPPPAPRVPPTAQPSPAGPGSCGPGVMEGAGGPAASSIAFGSPLCCTSPGF